MSVLSGHARVAGIAGWPVTYSRSPRLHGFWLQRHGIDGAYIPLRIRPGEFATAMRGLLAAGFAGANVTIPHKLAAFDICDSVDGTARRAGAVNTLVFHEGRIAGSNTDGYGFIANLRSHGVQPAGGPVSCWAPEVPRVPLPRHCRTQVLPSRWPTEHAHGPRNWRVTFPGSA